MIWLIHHFVDFEEKEWRIKVHYAREGTGFGSCHVVRDWKSRLKVAVGATSRESRNLFAPRDNER